MEKSAKIYVAGHRGMVGSAIVRKLKNEGFDNIVTASSSELDLRSTTGVSEFFRKQKPDYVFLAAAKVGGILANDLYSADFIYDNLMIQNNVIHQSHMHKVKKLLFLGSSCIYPKLCPQPILEEYLLTGPLEPTNDAYAVAKIAGIKMCQSYRKQYNDDFISVMPTNLYGPGDNYDLQNSHVLPALIRKFHEAKVAGLEAVEIWGSGRPKREFLHVDDLADACFFLMQNYSSPDIVNIGTGSDVTIREVANIISEEVGFKGLLTFNTEKPDGTPRKLLDVSKLHGLGWHHLIDLNAGISDTYRNYRESIEDGSLKAGNSVI